MPRPMVKGGGDLNQPVKESLLLTLGFQPHSLERLVRCEELARVEEANALGQAVVHRFSVVSPS
jgi:hypothetical protein